MQARPNEVYFESRKWPDKPHWRMHLDVLGCDEYGTSSRPSISTWT